MNMSSLISRIKTELGLYSIALPLDNVDATIAEVIINTTLRTYSQYFPQYEIIRKSSAEIERLYRNLEYCDMTLEVPDGSEIVFVADIYPDATDVSGIGYYGAGMPIYSPNMITDLLTANIGANLTNMMFPKLTWHFQYPNKLRVYHLYGGNIFIKCAKLHDKSLTSVPFSQEETFTNIAILDVKKAMYNIIKHYNELETAHGRINLKIDDWADSYNERKELLREWDDTFHLEQKSIYFA